jgi:hypothetical protein
LIVFYRKESSSHSALPLSLEHHAGRSSPSTLAVASSIAHWMPWCSAGLVLYQIVQLRDCLHTWRSFALQQDSEIDWHLAVMLGVKRERGTKEPVGRLSGSCDGRRERREDVQDAVDGTPTSVPVSQSQTQRPVEDCSDRRELRSRYRELKSQVNGTLGWEDVKLCRCFPTPFSMPQRTLAG